MLSKFIENPENHSEFLDTIDLDLISAPSSLLSKVENETERVRNLTRADWEERRSVLQDFIVSFSNAVGAGDSSYNDNYSVAGVISERTPTDSEYQILFALNDLLSEIDTMIYEKFGSEGDTVDTLDYVAGIANASGTAFQVPVSKYPVPFPYGSTLEQLAYTYLGTPDRWHEIATLNGLREPYVDEEGFDVLVVGAGEGNRLPIASATNLTINQSVWIGAVGVTRTKRHILNISESNGYVVLTLDGEADLSIFSEANQAYLHAFLPDTINSQMVIYIPSNAAPAAYDEDLPVPPDDKFDVLINVAGVDLLLSSDNDLVVTQDGDGRWAYGLNHLVQRVRVALSTLRGSILRHPEFGIPIEVGMSVSDLSIQDLKKMVENLFADDPAFASVNNVSVVQTGPSLNIALGIQVKNMDQPIAVAIKVLK